MVKSIRDAITAEAAAKEAAAKPVMQEIAPSGDGRDITMGYLGKVRPSQDTVLAARGGGLEIYEDVLRDPQVFSTFQQRRLAVVSKEWDVEAGAKDKTSQMAADFLREQIASVGFDGATSKMLHGLFYGYAAAECLFATDGSRVALNKIKVRKARRFVFDNDGNLRLLTQQSAGEGELMPPRKFWTFAAGADNDDEPYGLGLGHWCYWPVWFKKNGIRFWSMFLDKFGAPTAVGKFPHGTSEADQRKLLDAVSAIRRDSGVIIPEGLLIELLEAKRSGTSDNMDFHDTMDAAIAKVILSQTMTTDNGSSRSQGEVHEDVKQEVVKADADLICASFNDGPARWLTEWNFPGATPPKVWRDIEPPEDLDKRADRDTKIYQLGFEPSEEYIQETYGEGWTKKAPAAPPVLPGLPGNPLPPKMGDPAVEFSSHGAEPDMAGLLAEQAQAVGAKAIDALIDEIREIHRTSQTMSEFNERLMIAYPNMKVDDLAAVIRDAMVDADLVGRSEVTNVTE